jgi:hypothetical protein
MVLSAAEGFSLSCQCLACILCDIAAAHRLNGTVPEWSWGVTQTADGLLAVLEARGLA